MAEQKIGNAYLEVVPKVSKNFGSELKNATKAAGASAGESTGASYGSGFSAKMITAIGAGATFVGNTLSKMVEELVKHVGELFAGMFEGFANFESLKGGMESIFNEADMSQIMADAAGAYHTMNLSANEYLASINKIGAAFTQTMGDQRGYDTAKRGMMAIADYANGTSQSVDILNDKYRMITRATSSYITIADQFSGILPQTTKDFLEQAQAAGFLSDEYESLTDVPLAEYQEAVTKMIERGVEQQGFLGSTAEKSASTVKGSMAQMRAAWENFLAAVGDGGRTLDLSATVDALLDSVVSMLSNAIPTIGRIIASLVMKLPGMIFDALKSLPSLMQQAITDAFGSDAGDMFAPFADAMNSILSIAETVWPTIQSLITLAIDSIGNVVSDIMPIVGNTIAAIFEQTRQITEAVWPAIQFIVDAACQAIVFATDGLQPIVSFVQGIFNGIKKAIEDPITTAKNIVKNAIDAIKSFFQFKIQWPHIPLPHFSISGSVNPLDWITQGVPRISIDWYAKGGYVDGATLIGAGEKGGEMIWPSYEPWLSNYADALADSMAERGVGDTFVFNITADSETTLQSLVAQAQRARIAYGRA